MTVDSLELHLAVITTIEVWGERGLSAQELARGVGVAFGSAAYRSLVGILGAYNGKWFVQDEKRRWHPRTEMRSAEFAASARQRRGWPT